MYLDMPGPFLFQGVDSTPHFAAQGDYPTDPSFWDQRYPDPSPRCVSALPLSALAWSEPGQHSQRPLPRGRPLYVDAAASPCRSPLSQYEFCVPFEPGMSIPSRAYDRAGESPSSRCSSDLSPRTDMDLSHENFAALYDGRPPWSASGSHTSLCDMAWPSEPLCQLAAPNHINHINHINPNDVLVVPNPQEVTFQDDEGSDMDTKTEDVIEVQPRVSRPAKSRGPGRHSRGAETPVKDEDSIASDSSEPEAGGSVEPDDEMDVDREDVDDGKCPDVEEEEDEDAEYSPRASRAGAKRRRTARTSPASQTGKKSKVSKNTKHKLQCKDCRHSARDGAALAKHVAAQHARHYVCTFSFAGCKSTFGNKNEWKRHVTSQHLCLQYWLCNVGDCGQGRASHGSRNGSGSGSGGGGGGGGRGKGNDFNRKDLFTQHLRRMHAPFSVKRQQRKDGEWEERVKELQSSCLKTRRHPPTRTRCPVRDCPLTFEGPNSWDERMEHVGRHLEKTATAGAAPLNAATATASASASASASAAPVAAKAAVIDQESDEFMIEWALAERIIERKSTGGYRFCNDGAAEAGEEEDAEGEEE